CAEKWSGHQRSGEPRSPAEPLQLRVVDSEVMRHFVDDRLANFAADAIGPAATHLFDDGFPEQRDAVRGDQVIAAPPIETIDTLIQAEQVLFFVVTHAPKPLA